MNIRSILKIYTLERQLNPDDIALLNTLRSMNESERELLVESLSPASKTTKKVGRKASSKSAGKSSRASGMAAIISGNLSQRRQIICGYIYPDKSACNQPEDNPIHAVDGGYAGYHEFTTGKSSAPRAAGKSSTNGGAMSSTANSATDSEDVSPVAHEARAGG